MIKASLQKYTVYWTPAIVLLAVVLFLPHAATQSPARQELVQISPYLAAGAGLFLALHFHRGRSFLSIFLLVSTYWLARNYLAGSLDGFGRQALYQAVALVLPLNLALLVYLPERDLFSVAGQLRTALLAIEAVCVFWIFRYNFTIVQPVLLDSYLPSVVRQLLHVSQPAFLVTLLGLSAVVIKVCIRRTPFDIGMLGTLVAFFVAWNWATTPFVLPLYSLAGIVLISLAVLQDSYNMAFRDELTGIPSRRALNERLAGIGRHYTVAMADIDHFKKFNDTYGHDVGDQVLKMVAMKLATVGGGGETFRYGGEEFTILFPKSGVKEAQVWLEDICAAVAAYPMHIRGGERPKKNQQGKSLRKAVTRQQTVQVTVSIGVAERREGMLPDATIKAADKALYKAKNSGRNQVCSG